MKCEKCGAPITILGDLGPGTPFVYDTSEIERLQAENKELKRWLQEAQILCRVYFEIAEEFFSKNVIRRKRDAKINKINLAKKADAGGGIG